MSRVKLPPPANWQDFETLCLEVWRAFWRDPAAQKHGRSGQPQAGVDVFGRMRGIAEWHGVQCKLTDEPRSITTQVIEAELANAAQFTPPLHSFTIATTAPRDFALQERARTVSRDHAQDGRLPVSISSWDDILDIMESCPQIMRVLYPQFVMPPTLVTANDRGVVATITEGGEPMRDCTAVFDDPTVRSLVVEELRTQLEHVATELILNAFQHGASRKCEILVERNQLIVTYDGTSFDPLSSKPRHARAGLTFLKLFVNHWKDRIRASYSHTGDKNVFKLRAYRPWSSPEFIQNCGIKLKRYYLHGPILTSHVELARGCTEYLLRVPVPRLCPSSFVEFLQQLLKILPDGTKLRLVFEKGDFWELFVREGIASGWFPGDRIIVDSLAG